MRCTVARSKLVSMTAAVETVLEEVDVEVH